MIKLTEILQDSEELRHFKNEGATAKKAAAFLLSQKGLDAADGFILRLKEQSKLKDWIALYRSHSVMSGTPIFWINSNLREYARQIDPSINIVRVMTDSIIHEWWHAICEALKMASYRKTPLKIQVVEDMKVEEQMAEKFIAFCGGDAWSVVSDKEAEYFELAIEEFNNLWA